MVPTESMTTLGWFNVRWPVAVYTLQWHAQCPSSLLTMPSSAHGFSFGENALDARAVLTTSPGAASGSGGPDEGVGLVQGVAEYC